LLIGVEAATTSGQRPIASNIRWLLRDSAVERSSKLGWLGSLRATASTMAMRSPSGSKASARQVPVMPPPAMTMSYRLSDAEAILSTLNCFGLTRWCGAGRHQLFDLVRIFSETPAQNVRTLRCHCDVVLYADADVSPTRRSIAVLGDVDAGLNGRYHPWLQQAPLIVDPVVTYVMDIHAQPVARPMHEEFAVSTIPNELRHRALQ